MPGRKTSDLQNGMTKDKKNIHYLEFVVPYEYFVNVY